jgi:hypothetical protein
MRYARTIIPTVFLVLGTAAAQPPVPTPAAPRAVPAVPSAPVPAVAPYGQFNAFDLQDRQMELQQKYQELERMAELKEMTAARSEQAKMFAEQAKAWSMAQSDWAAMTSMQYGTTFAQQPAKAPLGFAQSEDSAYDAGQRALENRRWEEALERFNQVIARAGSRADGAWFWKAYSLRKLGRRDDSLAAIAELRKSYPNSRWLDDSKALELEVRQASGQNVAPESESDEELKLMALNGLMRSDPDRAFPLLENLLKSAQSPRLKKNAVFVLAQSESPKAAQLLEQVARGQGNPDLQLTAIRYLGERRRTSNGPQILMEIYNASSDAAIKRAVISALSGNRDKDRLLQIARSEKDQSLRITAIRSLASTNNAQAELWQLYQGEATPEGKRTILQAMPPSGNQEKLLEIARTEKDVNLRRYAIQSLSPQSAGAADALVALYSGEQDAGLKRTIIDSLYSQRNAKALVQVARNEHDIKMKQMLVERLGNMKDPAATEYLMEILK